MIEKKKLAVIGGSYLQLPAVKKAKELGYEVHCFSWSEGAVCEKEADYFYNISITEKEKILDECKKIGIDGILTISSDLAVITVNFVASKLGLISNPDADTAKTTNKFLMRQCFKSHQIPSPNYWLVKGEKDLSSIIPYINFPVIVKPTDRSGSKGVEKVEDICSLKKSVKRACIESFSNEAIVEDFLLGRELSVETISWEGKHYILAFTDKVTTGAPFFVELEHHQPANLSQIETEKIKEIVLNALNALGIKYGASHSELIVSKNNEIKIIEIGARMGGDFIGSDLVKLSTGYDFLKATIKVCMGIFQPPRILNNKYSGIYFLSKETEHCKKIIDNSCKYKDIVKSELISNDLKKVECSSDRNGYFIYCSKNKFVVYVEK